MQHLILFFSIICFFISPNFKVRAQKYHKIWKVVIDAGHGGKDSGALGRHCKEKDIALSIALKTGNYIEKNLKDVKVIYTRRTDKFVELYKRAEIANKSKADLFISIHCNSNPSHKPYGAETYVMGLNKSKANLEVAKKENAAILEEDDYLDKYNGFEPNSDEAYIIFNLYQNAYLEQSLDFASKVEKQFKNKVGIHDRGVKQAGFLVLYKITMPGVLIETGFLSNAKEEKFLISKKGRVYIASAIYRAFKEYKNEIEKNNLKEKVKENKNNLTKQNIDFRVQFASFKEHKSLNSQKFNGIKQVKEYYHKGLYKYTTGNAKTYKDAVKIQSYLKKKGFKNTFIVAFLNNKRISIKKAKQLLKNNLKFVK